MASRKLIQQVMTFGKSKEDKVTGFHLFYGFAKISSLNEMTLHAIFSPEECDEIAAARKAMEDESLDLNLIKQGVPLLEPYVNQNSQAVSYILENADKMPVEILIHSIVEKNQQEMNIFRQGNSMKEVLKRVDELKNLKREASDKTEDMPVFPEQASSEPSEGDSQAESFSSQHEDSRPGKTDALNFFSMGDRYRTLLSEILNIVKGQDHAVLEFVKGCFQAEIQAENHGRKCPAATFFLMGPPGVGKTLLAETAASSLGREVKLFDMSMVSDRIVDQILRFARKNPDGILIFDEVEKAGPLASDLFLQILDRGSFQDVSFQKSFIIFTSNVGHNLYEDHGYSNPSMLPKAVLLDAIRNDVNPLNGNPYLSGAFCSRIAAGNVIMFNNLSASELAEIVSDRLDGICRFMQKRFGMEVLYDKETLPLLFLYSYGGDIDARIAAKQSEIFLKNELYEIIRQMYDRKEEYDQIQSIEFKVDTDCLSEELRPLFLNQTKTDLLVLCNPEDRVRYHVPEDRYTVRFVSNAQELKEAGETDLILVDPFCGWTKESRQRDGLSIDDMNSEGIRVLHDLSRRRTPAPYLVVQTERHAFTDTERETLMEMGVTSLVYRDTCVGGMVRQLDVLCSRIYREKQREIPLLLRIRGVAA